MKEREKTIVTGLVTFLLLIWLGFLLHVNPAFSGRALGLFLGIAGAALMFVPLLYLVIKRIKPLRRSVTRKISMRTLLSWHIYADVSQCFLWHQTAWSNDILGKGWYKHH